jgi:hypothetical protein
MSFLGTTASILTPINPEAANSVPDIREDEKEGFFSQIYFLSLKNLKLQTKPSW